MKHLAGWIETRTGFGSALESFFNAEIPASAGWPQVFGAVALFVLFVQVLTGMLLAFNYAASPGDAYDSVTYIITTLPGGRMIRGLHHWGASMMVIVLAVHGLQVFLSGAYRKPREATWLFGVVLLLLVLGLGLTGYLLPWDNRAYWGTVVTTQIAGQAPGLGSYMQRLIGAEDGVGAVTFARFYALHVLILPAGTMLFTALHLLLVRKHGVAPSRREEAPRTSFFPVQVFRDTVAVFIAFLLLFAAAAFLDAPLDRMADPTDTSYVPRPEWYFLFLFQVLKYFHGPLEVFASVGLPTIAVLALVLLPFLDRDWPRLHHRRRWAAVLAAVCLSTWSFLTYTAWAGTPKSNAVAGSPRVQRVLLLAPDELAGFSYFRRQNCNSCHNVVQGDPKAGPNLAPVESRRSPDWLESHFRHPSSETAAGNPPGLSSPQMNALVSFVAKLTPEKALALETAPASLLEGADVYVSNLCVSCHKVNGAGGQTGPSLNGLSARRSRQWIAKHFQSPRVLSPGSIMPPYHLPSNEQEQLISYLLQLP